MAAKKLLDEGLSPTVFERNAEPVDLMKTLPPAAGHFDLLIGPVIAVRIDDQGDARLADDEQAIAVLVPRRGEVHADRCPQAALVFEEEIRSIFQAVGIGVGQELDSPVVANRQELAIGSIEHVVDVRQFDG